MEPKQKESLLALFQSTSSSLRETDPEWVKIVADFSLEELSAANGLTERERMICILSVLLGCQGMGEYRHMLHAGLGSNRHQRNPLSSRSLFGDWACPQLSGSNQSDYGTAWRYNTSFAPGNYGRGFPLCKGIKKADGTFWKRYRKAANRLSLFAPKYQPLAGR